MDIFFQIDLSTYDRNSVLLHIKPQSKIDDVKALLRTKLNISDQQPMHLSIMGMGKVLENGRTVTDYNLHNGSIITVKISVRGATDKVESTKDNDGNHATAANGTNPSNTSNNTNSNKEPTFYDKIGFFPTQSKERKIPKYYNYTKVITIIEVWCRSFGIKAIETELLDFIAIYTSYIHSKILCIAEDELRSCYFQVYVQLKGVNQYFKEKNHDIKRLWLDQYIELKMGRLEENQLKRRGYVLNSVNYSHNFAFSNMTTLQCYDLKQSEFDGNKNEMFVLSAHMPSAFREIYKVKGELTDLVCWVEFGFMKKQNVKVFGLRSNMFAFTYQGLNVENNKEGLDQKIVRNRELWIDIEIVKVLKREALYEAMSKLQLVERVQNRLKHRFWPQDLLIKQRISSLADDGYCIVVGEQLLYLDGPHTEIRRDHEEDF